MFETAVIPPAVRNLTVVSGEYLGASIDLEVLNASVDRGVHGKVRRKQEDQGTPAFKELVEESLRRSWHRRKVKGQENMRHQRRKAKGQDYQSVCSYYELMY